MTLPAAKTINLKLLLNSFLMLRGHHARPQLVLSFSLLVLLFEFELFSWQLLSFFLLPVSPFIHSSFHSFPTQLWSVCYHLDLVLTAGSFRWAQQTCPLLTETPCGPTPQQDHAIAWSASFSRLSAFRTVSAFLRVVWSGLCEVLLITSPGEPGLWLGKELPRMQAIIFQTPTQPGSLMKLKSATPVSLYTPPHLWVKENLSFILMKALLFCNLILYVVELNLTNETYKDIYKMSLSYLSRVILLPM